MCELVWSVSLRGLSCSFKKQPLEEGLSSHPLILTPWHHTGLDGPSGSWSLAAACGTGGKAETRDKGNLSQVTEVASATLKREASP